MFSTEHSGCVAPAPTSFRRRSPRFASRRRRTQIAALYGRLSSLAPSPVVELNHAVAVAMAEGPEQGLALIDRIDGLDRYRHLHSARADLLRRLGRTHGAAVEDRLAVHLATQPAERAFLERRLAEVRSPT